MFESQLHGSNSFITLTYDDANVPFPPSLDYSHFQKFMKRLRKASATPLRFFMAGEYGSNLGRPHFHACIFGTDFSDRILWSNLDSGFPLYRSPHLEKLWPFGFSSVADLSFESAAYVARYSLKKITGDLAHEHYRFVDVETGESHQRTPEFCHMSLKPGIGGGWFEKYSSDVYDGHDYVMVNGHKCKPPRYFDKLYRRMNRDEHDFIKSERGAFPASPHNSDARLAVRERVQLAAMRQLSPRGDL